MSLLTTLMQNDGMLSHIQICVELTLELCFACLCPGAHSVEVLYDGAPVPNSPFQVGVSDGCDPTRVVAKGPGLEGALTDKANKFSIITRYSNPAASHGQASTPHSTAH